jgi:alpha-glucosidase
VRLLWNWQLNRELYPNWDEMLDDWEKDGVRPMVYMNPYFADLSEFPDVKIRENLFKQGDDNGYFVKDAQTGKSLLINSISINFGMIDFTNPDARTWAKNIIKDNMLTEARSVGWMADFAEYTPLVAKYHDWQAPSATYHNRYPYEWTKLNQEAVAEAGKSDETVYFTRSGSTISPGVASLYWMGDQMPTLDRYDGLHSSLIGMMNGGICGFGLGHSDIGGYTTIDMPEAYAFYRRDYEVLKRWSETNAFSDAVFRTHPSNIPAFNDQIWDNEEIGGFFAKFAHVFARLGKYRMKLMKELETSGIPITRSLMFELDDTNNTIDDQFFLGSEIMMAPILETGATSRKVFFPQGKWMHMFTKDKYHAGKFGETFEVEVPLGSPAAFKRIGHKEELDFHFADL